MGFLTLLVALLFFWFSYSSPVKEAGREFKKDIRTYQRAEIETMDDVYDRLEVLDKHFHSTTFDKVQNADKTEITQADIQTLFGKSDEIVEEVEMSAANTVSRYFYDEFTVNIHQKSYSFIDEYVTEQFNAVFYEPHILDELFIETIQNHQSQTNKIDEQFEPISKEKVSQVMGDKLPTRNIRQSGWFTWTYNQHDYFDDGQGEYAPKEYLSLQYEENEVTELK